jgi:hypothetical protein
MKELLLVDAPSQSVYQLFTSQYDFNDPSTTQLLDFDAINEIYML